jgi:cytochrome c2
LKPTAARVLVLLVASTACSWFRAVDLERGARLTGGNPESGRKKLVQHSCGTCHIISGVPNANGTTGPSLEYWSRRSKFLDNRPNTPENLEQWLEHSSRFKPGTGMPDMDVSPEDSRDMSAYLFSINR